jgi:hypothetical protein
VPITQESIDYDAKKQTAFIKADSSVLKENSDDQTVEGNEVNRSTSPIGDNEWCFIDANEVDGSSKRNLIDNISWPSNSSIKDNVHSSNSSIKDNVHSSNSSGEDDLCSSNNSDEDALCSSNNSYKDALCSSNNSDKDDLCSSNNSDEDALCSSNHSDTDDLCSSDSLNEDDSSFSSHSAENIFFSFKNFFKNDDDDLELVKDNYLENLKLIIL